MTRLYTPDRWVLLRFTEKKTGEVTNKVLAGWYGGYLNGDSWKLSSGVTEAKHEEGYVDFLNYSGSTYRCYDASHGMGLYMHSVYESFSIQLAEAGMGTVEIVDNY